MIGFGYDIHRFKEGRPLILGGVEISHTHGLDGHSDADVLSHAIADAILGTLGLPDIGHWFPPGDPSCKDINSLLILEKAAALIRERGYELVNIDSTLVAEAPKVLPHREAMQKKIAEALGLAPERIGIKATTNELLGAIGRQEGIAAMAVALIKQA
ncbi:2-C-methyl-D-erythritol 2,4-cyclodiphosphate synthase [Haloferula chungangensis]|uniref:2-C-methyl-D-erythritol 2,4-cyclodiphosphate synthase n=1 Tax=Haloferula chungangensis TaxID=1048331 RepID=A0ABW2LBQ9_9BACT